MPMQYTNWEQTSFIFRLITSQQHFHFKTLWNLCDSIFSKKYIATNFEVPFCSQHIQALSKRPEKKTSLMALLGPLIIGAVSQLYVDIFLKKSSDILFIIE